MIFTKDDWRVHGDYVPLIERLQKEQPSYVFTHSKAPEPNPKYSHPEVYNPE